MKKKSKKIYSKTVTGLSILKSRDYHNPMFIPIVGSILLFIIGVTILIFNSGFNSPPSSSRVVEVYDNGKIKIIPTTATTVGDLVKRLHIVTNTGDVIEPTENTPILTNGFRVNIYRVHPVTIIENGLNKVILTANINPRVIVAEAGYQTYPQDYVYNETTPTNLTKNIIGQVVLIEPATQINLSLYGTKVSLRTHAKTVAELLNQNLIKTTTGANVLPALATPITTGMQVLVVPLGQQLISVQKTIAFDNRFEDNPNMPLNSTKIVQVGVLGSELIVEQIIIKNGISTNTPIQTVVIVQPIEQIIDRGTGISAVNGGDNITWLRSSDIDSSDYGYVNYIISNESGWCSTKWQGEIGYCPGFYQPLHPITSGFGYGLGQATPAGKMARFGNDWATNPVTQLEWANSYAVGRYGSWSAAYNYWVKHHNW